MSTEKNSFGLQVPRKGWYRAEIKDPLSGKNLVFQGADPVIVAAQRDEIKRLAVNLRAGFISAAEVQAQRARVTGGFMTLEACVKKYLDTVSFGTLRAFSSAWKCRIEHELGHLAIAELTKSRLEKWERDEAEKDISQKTIANAWGVIRSSVRLAIADGLVPDEPWANYTVKVPKVEHLEAEITRDIDELRALVVAAKDHDDDAMRFPNTTKWSCLWIKIIVGTCLALRQGELAALGWDDLHLRGGAYVVIRHQVVRDWKVKHPTWDRPQSPPKGRKECVLPLPEDVILVLAIQRKALEAIGQFRPDGPVFPTNQGEWRSHPRTIDEKTFKDVFMQAIPDAKRANVYPHGLRHSGVTLTLQASGGDLARTKKLSRHSELRMLDKYVHVATRDASHPMPRLFAAQRVALPSMTEVLESEPLALHEYVTRQPTEQAETTVDNNVEEALLVLRALTQEVQDKRLESVDELAATVSIERFVETNEEKRERLRREALRQSVRNSKAKKAGRLPVDLHAIYQEWTAAGRVEPVPVGITEEANRAYARAYVKANRADKPTRWKVWTSFATWEALARDLLKGDEPTPAQIDAIRAENQAYLMPPTIGQTLVLPAEIQAIRKGRLGRRGFIGGWFRVVKKLDRERLAKRQPQQDPSLESISS